MNNILLLDYSDIKNYPYIKRPPYKKGYKQSILEIKNNINDKSKSHYYILHNLEKNKCMLDPECKNHLLDILSYLNKKFFDNTILYTYIKPECQDFELIVNSFLENNFYNPYMTKEGLCIYRKNKQNININKNLVKKQIEYAIQNIDNINCNLSVKFSVDAINFLSNASKNMGFVKNKQKEISGEMTVNISKDNTFIIDVDKNSIKSGNEENVSVSFSRYNFHSHPKQAYEKNNVKNAWPSGNDFLGFYELRNHTIFHCVITLEGVYIISFSKYWCNKLDSINRNFIKNNYEIYYTDNLTPKQFVKKVNSIKYKGHPVFKVIFLDWKSIKNKFEINFSKLNNSCLINQEMFNVSKNII